MLFVQLIPVASSFKNALIMYICLFSCYFIFTGTC